MSDYTSPIVAFYTEAGTDHRGRTFKDYMSMGDSAREYTHDYIQWLFPLTEASRFNEDAPVLTEEDIQVLCESKTAQYRLTLAALRMESFYWNYEHWRNERDHNHMRITRILKCLRLLGAQDLANEFACMLHACPEQEELAEAWPFWEEALGVR